VSAAIEVRDLFRIHATPQGDAAALQGLSLTVPEREVLVVLGPSGAGKTTLLRILAGLDRPSAGSVRVFGQELSRLSPRALAGFRARALGYADQHYARALAPELTVRGLVSLRLALAGASRSERLARADELLDRVGLAHTQGRRPFELSGGEQQRIAVCAALAHRPRLLLADEPTGELDAASARAVFELLGELAREAGCTTVIVSHDPACTAIADRTIRIRDGRVSEEEAAGSLGETIVVGRGGWLRLPEELLRRARIGERAAARLEGGEIVVSPAGEQAPVEQAAPAVERSAVPGSAVVEARGLARRYGAATALAGVHATAAAGALTVVTGPSGSGKSTFLHLVAGLDRPTEGDVAVLGTSLGALDRDARAAFRREHIAVVAQQTALVAFLSARENVELGLALRGRTGGALEALAAVGLAERAEQRVARLSAGEQVRVAIARALAAGPALLIADEPTARLDQANALAVAALLARLARETGTAVLCATHDPLVIEQADAEIPLG
jgi:ABC-type lipoprotein export system ATPase subunit